MTYPNLLLIAKSGKNYSKPAPTNASFTFDLLLSAISHNGNRVSAAQMPSNDAAYFTGPGLASQNMAS